MRYCGTRSAMVAYVSRLLSRLANDPLWTLATAAALALVVLAYWLSYGSLRELSGSGAWPLCLDLPGLIAGFLAIRRARQGDSDYYEVALAIFFGLAIVAGNTALAWPTEVRRHWLIAT